MKRETDMDMDITLIQMPLLSKEGMEPEEALFYEQYWRRFSKIVDRDVPKVPIYDVKEIPLWIAALGATLERADYSVDVLDLSKYNGHTIDMEAIRKELSSCRSRIFGLSPFTNSFSVCVKIAKMIKAEFGSDAVVLVGGPHVSNTDLICMQEGCFDAVVKGEGDLIIPQLVKAVKEGKDFSGIGGITWMQDGEIKVNPAIEGHSDPDDLPLPAYHLIPQTYRGNIPFGRLYTSRGCAFNCAYCADILWKRRKPIHSKLSRVIEQVELMRKFFDIDLIYVGDESFTFNPDFVRDFSVEMKQRGFKWISQTRTDLINEKTLQMMYDGNCKLIKYGAESANASLLKLIRKGITVDSIERACEMAKSVGLNVLLYWMVGLPDESRETAENTVKYAERLFDKNLIDLVEYYITTPYPGTDLFLHPERYHIDIEGGTDFDRWREDRPSVTHTRYLSNIEIFEIWKDGLARFSKCIGGKGDVYEPIGGRHE